MIASPTFFVAEIIILANVGWEIPIFLAEAVWSKPSTRLSLIASTFITKDFSANQELKNRWALVYKLLSYSKGLRDDITYRNYDDTMKTLFGENYDPEIIFDESNKETAANIDKLRAKLLTLNFNSSQS